MKKILLGTVLLLPILGLPAAKAADLPQPVSALIGPGIGYMLGQSDLCGWNLNTQIKTAYQNAFTGMGLSATQQAAIWQAAALRQKKLDNLPFAARNGMRKGVCGASDRATVEAQISQ